MNPIDKVISSLYNKGTKYKELTSLYKLFDSQLGDAIAKELSNKLKLYDSARDFEKIYVDFQWVDKIPLASFVKTEYDYNGNKITNKTELGDLFIQYRHTNSFGNSVKSGIHPISHRALVVQAKLAKQDNPLVPIARMSKTKADSTSKELRLLEHWPEFDLYETSRSSLPLAKNLTVSNNGNPFSFYAGFNDSSKAWSCGVAKYGQVCDKKFSDVILELALDQAGKHLSQDTAWATISKEITKTCNNRNIPPSIAKQIESRNRTTNIAGGKTYSFPANLMDWFVSIVQYVRSTFAKRKVLVITIDRVSYEGELMNRYR